MKSIIHRKIALTTAVLCIIFVGMVQVGIAQPTYKNSLPLDMAVQLQPELYMKSNQRLYAELDLRVRQEGTSRIGNGPLGAAVFRIGYEKWIRGIWGIGASYQSQRLPNERVGAWQGYGVHNGRIGEKWVFVKQLRISRYSYQLSLQDPRFFVEGSAYLGRRFNWMGKQWQPGLGFTAGKLGNLEGEARRISQSQLTASIDFPLGEQIICRLFYTKSTQYFFGLAQERYDPDGNLIESIPFHQLNIITPTLGVSFRYLIRQELANEKLPFVFRKE